MIKGYFWHVIRDNASNLFFTLLQFYCITSARGHIRNEKEADTYLKHE